MSNFKKVIIIGRANVGKSTLFNRFSTNVTAITSDFAGVTRDFIRDTVSWRDSTFELIDSGGLILRKTQDEIALKVRDIGLNLINQADLILFVCDGTTGILPEDRDISQILHKSGKKVILLVNKIDTKLAKEQQYEFENLGFSDVIAVSAEHAINVGDLLDLIVDNIGSTEKKEEEAKFKIVLLGKPNVGKSSLLNCLLQEERSIVADWPGTTREAVSEKIRFYKETLQITDTAGVRRKRAVEEGIEELMVKNTLYAVKEADIVLLLLDSSANQVSDQELKLAFYVLEEGKALIILFNKEDLVTELGKKEMDFSLSPYQFILKKLETLTISCKTGKNIGKILPLVDKVWQRHSQKFSDIELTDLFKSALNRTPLYHKTCLLMLFNARQISSVPITILLKVNESKWFEQSQLSFFENILRSKYDLRGVPVVFITRKRRE